MKFECTHCHQRLSATPAAAGSLVRCPSCNNRIEVPAPTPEALEEAPPTPAAGERKAAAPRRKAERQAWKETDPTNPHFLHSLGIGFGLLVLWFGLLLPFNPPADRAIARFRRQAVWSSRRRPHSAQAPQALPPTNPSQPVASVSPSRNSATSASQPSAPTPAPMSRSSLVPG